MKIWICEKCGQRFHDKRENHTVFEIYDLVNDKGKTINCDGKLYTTEESTTEALPSSSTPYFERKTACSSNDSTSTNHKEPTGSGKQ